jgi:hypothetical protein
MIIDANEMEIRGAWVLVGGKMEADANARRIDELVHKHLREVGRDQSGWDVLYVDPKTGRFWELVYLESESHGGGPPVLRNLSVPAARAKYGEPSITKAERLA